MALKSYKINVETQQDMEAMEFLIKDHIAMGKNLVNAVTEYAQKYYKRRSKRKSAPTLVTEAELLKIAKERGLTTGKSSIVQYRRKGVLCDKSGPWYFQNAQNKLVYKLEPMLGFLENRHREPKTRIEKTKTTLH